MHRVDWLTNKLDTQRHSISNVLDSQIFQEVLLLIPIYSDSVSCEQLKAVDIIFKEEGHVCPTNTLTNKTTTNEKYTNIVQPCGISNSTS
jgi:hypothetical protein